MRPATRARTARRHRALAIPTALHLLACGGDTPTSVGAEASGGGSSTTDTNDTAVVEGACNSVVRDPALAAYLWHELDLPPGSIIPSDALATLPWIDVAGLGVTTLAGVECAVGIESLSIARDKTGHTNAVTDLAPIAGLPRLERLHLGDNPITDLSTLPTLPLLTFLDIERTGVSDLGPLADCSALEMLYASGTPISDVEPLAAAPSLRSIELDDTLVSDVTPLARIEGLYRLKVSGTAVSNVSVFRDTGLELLWADELDLGVLPERMPLHHAHFARNGIVDIAPFTSWDDPGRIDLADNEIDDLSPLLEIPWEGGPGGCLEIDLRGNPLRHPDTANVMQEICDRFVVRLLTDSVVGCSHADCVGPPP